MNSRFSEREGILHEALTALKAQGTRLTLTDDPEYPQYLAFTSDEADPADQNSSGDDSFEDDLLAWAFKDQTHINLHSLEPGWALIRTGRPDNGRAAVYTYARSDAADSAFGAEIEEDIAERTGNGTGWSAIRTQVALPAPVYQITDIPRTRQTTSVVGRVGVVNILGRKLAEALRTADPRTQLVLREGDELTITELALLAAGDDVQDFDARAKFLRRLNEGNTVGMSTVESLADALAVDPNSLVFDQPNILDRRARLRRREVRQRAFAENRQEAMQALERSEVQFQCLVVNALKLMRRTLLLLQQDRLRLENATASVDDQEKNKRAIGTFTSAVAANPESLGPALASLNAAGLNAWLGVYEDQVRIDPEDHPKGDWPESVGSEVIEKGILAFREITAGPPKGLTVDLSHTASLGPTAEEIRARLSDE